MVSTNGWRIGMLGGFQAVQDGRKVTHFETRKTCALLAYLALHVEQPHSRDDLAERLWPDEDLDTIRSRLRQALSAIRRSFDPEGGNGDSALLTTRVEVQLNPRSVTTDVEEFESACQRAERASGAEEKAELLAKAVDVYRGDLLPGYHEEWIFAERERLRDLFRKALRQLSEVQRGRGDLSAAIDYAKRAVAVDPLREDAHCWLMRLLVESGRHSEAIRQYHELDRTLHQELAMHPSAAARSILEDLRLTNHPEIGTARVVKPREGNPRIAPGHLEPEGGAMPLDSAFYLDRPADVLFGDAIGQGDSIVLVKGPRQIGKTSLLARGLHRARQSGYKVAMTDFQKLTTEQFQDAGSLFRMLAESIAYQLDLPSDPGRYWSLDRGWNVNFERFLRREVLEGLETRFVWGLDEVDRLFEFPYGTEVFGLFRSWHNERSFDPTGPLSKLTLAIAYATEAHLFITDLNQSPFNVGTRMTLEDFTRGEIAELNHRYGEPLADREEVKRFYLLVGGHPHLVRRGLHTLVTKGIGLDTLVSISEDQGGPFEDHLGRILASLHRDPALHETVRGLLKGVPCSSIESFWRLRSAGVIVGESVSDMRFRCQLYERFLSRNLR